jgi:hypothetical protein
MPLFSAAELTPAGLFLPLAYHASQFRELPPPRWFAGHAISLIFDYSFRYCRLVSLFHCLMVSFH